MEVVRISIPFQQLTLLRSFITILSGRVNAESSDFARITEISSGHNDFRITVNCGYPSHVVSMTTVQQELQDELVYTIHKGESDQTESRVPLLVSCCPNRCITRSGPKGGVLISILRISRGPPQSQGGTYAPLPPPGYTRD